MEIYNRKAIFKELEDWCHFADENDYIEVTEWTNGEGVDIDIHSKVGGNISITYGEWKLLKKLIKVLKKTDG